MEMPERQVYLANNEIYHVINRGNFSLPIFLTKRDYRRFIQAFKYYQHDRPPMKFSKLYNIIPRQEREILLDKMKRKKEFLVEIIAYCLMPNHYHFILKQIKDDGILNFIRLFNVSYSCYFTTKHQKKGSLFEGRFKAVRVETDSQLLHLSRYVHLNPYSSYIAKNIEDLLNYPYSSLPEYLGLLKEEVCRKEIVLNNFSNLEDYKKFIFDRADYQRSLEEIKHHLLEE